MFESLEQRQFLSVTALNVDPSRSFITAAGTAAGAVATPQGANGLKTTFEGTISADIDSDSIQFLEASRISARDGGNYEPGNTPGNFGVKLDLGSAIVIKAAVRHLVFSIQSPEMPIAVNGTFSSTGGSFTVVGGTLAYHSEFATVGNGSVSLTDAPESQNTSSNPALIQLADGQTTITIPVSFTITYSAQSPNDSTLRVNGQIVATTGPLGGGDTTPTPTFASMTPGGLLSVDGTPGDDTLTLSVRGKNLVANLNSQSLAFTRSQVKKVNIMTGDGADLITIARGVPSVRIEAGIGNDTAVGGDGADEIYGGDGLDQLTGGRGNDVLNGGNDQDILRGGIGDDKLWGGLGVDQLWGDDGNDTFIIRDRMPDVIFGGKGKDTVTGDRRMEQIREVEIKNLA